MPPDGTISWKHGYGQPKVKYVSETSECFMNEKRDKEVRAAIAARTEPESKQLGKFLRKSNVRLSMHPTTFGESENQQRYVDKMGELESAESYADVRIAELRKANIDLSVGEPKTAKHWNSVLKATHSENADQKFACSKPQGREDLIAELRKSSVLLHAGRHDYRQETCPVRQSEQTTAYDTKPISKTLGFADTNGKLLRESNFGIGNVADPKTCSHWQSAQHKVMVDNMDKKFACKQPKGFDHLIAELRKTNINLGNDQTKYGTETRRVPIQDDTNRRPAGAAPAL